LPPLLLALELLLTAPDLFDDPPALLPPLAPPCALAPPEVDGAPLPPAPEEATEPPDEVSGRQAASNNPEAISRANFMGTPCPQEANGAATGSQSRSSLDGPSSDEPSQAIAGLLPWIPNKEDL
jgi:hypothetical protein